MDITEGVLLLTYQGDFCHKAKWIIAPSPPPLESLIDRRQCPACGKGILSEEYWAVVAVHASYHYWPKHVCSRACGLALTAAYDELEFVQHQEEYEMQAKHVAELEALRRKHNDTRRKIMLGHLAKQKAEEGGEG